MCRLLGWVSSSPRTLGELLGEDDLEAFTALSRIHGDGWGVSWGSGSGLAVRSSTEAAHASREFADWARSEPHDLGLVHLRWATLGLPVVAENTHPFRVGDTVFAHNGSIRPPAALDALLTPEHQAAMAGTTDSERYFRAVLSAAGPDPDAAGLEQALARTVTTVAADFDVTSLNCLLLTPDTLYAACRFEPGKSEQGPDYFPLRYRVTDDSVVVASTGWGREWQPLENGHLLTVRRDTLETSVVALEDLLVRSR